MDLIALVGFIGSGKDTVGRHLVEEHGFYDMAFADALKDTCAAIFCWDREMLDGKNPQSRQWRTEVDHWWAQKLGIPHFTPRWALQNIGTETLRRHFRDDLWILNVERRIQRLRDERPGCKIVLTDGRFPNELTMVRRLGGKVVRVRRGDEPEWYRDAVRANVNCYQGNDWVAIRQEAGLDNLDRMIGSGLIKLAQEEMDRQKVHISEWAWIGYPMDTVIDNDSTLDELFSRASGIVR